MEANNVQGKPIGYPRKGSGAEVKGFSWEEKEEGLKKKKTGWEQDETYRTPRGGGDYNFISNWVA